MIPIRSALRDKEKAAEWEQRHAIRLLGVRGCNRLSVFHFELVCFRFGQRRQPYAHKRSFGELDDRILSGKDMDVFGEPDVH